MRGVTVGFENVQKGCRKVEYGARADNCARETNAGHKQLSSCIADLDQLMDP